MYYAGREVDRKIPTMGQRRDPAAARSLHLSEFIISMHSTLSHPLPLADRFRFIRAALQDAEHSKEEEEDCQILA